MSQRTYDKGYQKGRYDAEHDKGYNLPGGTVAPFAGKDLRDKRRGYKQGYKDGK